MEIKGERKFVDLIDSLPVSKHDKSKIIDCCAEIAIKNSEACGECNTGEDIANILQQLKRQLSDHKGHVTTADHQAPAPGRHNKGSGSSSRR